MARNDHDIDIEIGAEIDGVKAAFAEIKRQAEALQGQLRPTTEALSEGFEKLGRQTLPNVAAKAELAAEKLRAQAKKIAQEIDGMDEKVEVDADVSPAKKALDDLKKHAKRAGDQIKSVADGMRSDFARIGGAISGLTGPVSTFGKLAAGVSFATAIGGAYSLKEIIDGLRERTLEMSEDIRRLTLSAEAFNLEVDGNVSEALKTVRAMEAVFESFGYEADDLNAIAGALTLEAGKALQGDEGAVDLMRNAGLFKSDIEDANGQLKSTDKIFASLAKRTGAMSNDMALMRLQELFGEDDGIRLFKVLNSLGDNFDDTIEKYKTMIDIRDTDFEASGELQDLLNNEKLAWENMNRAIFRGFVDPLSEATVARERFANAIGENAEVGSAAAGELYARTWETIARTGEEILAIITKIEDGTTPLEGGFERISWLIDSMAAGLVDVVELVATGKTEAPWLNGVIAKFQEFRAVAMQVLGEVSKAYQWVMDDVKPVLVDLFDFIKTKIQGELIPAIQQLWGYIDTLLTSFGADETWEQVGIIAGLLVFRSTIFSVIGAISSIVLKIGELTGATAALGGAAKTAATAAAGGAATVAKKAVKGGGVVGAAVAAGTFITDDADYMWLSDKAHDRALEIAKEQGDAVAAGYLKAIQDALEERHGQGLFGGRLSSWIDENLGTDVFWDKDKAELGIALVVDESNAADAARGAMLAFQEAGGWAVDDDGRVEIGAGFTISGAELKAGVIEGVQAQLDAAPLTLSLKQIDILAGLENYQIELPEIKAPASVSEGGSSNATPLQPVNLIVDGQRVGGIQVPPDQVETVRRALQTAARARS